MGPALKGEFSSAHHCVGSRHSLLATFTLLLHYSDSFRECMFALRVRFRLTHRRAGEPEGRVKEWDAPGQRTVGIFIIHFFSKGVRGGERKTYGGENGYVW